MAEAPYLMGIDYGTGGVRVGLFDREGTPAYLDATSVGSKRLYERHGFRAGDPYAPAGGPPLWPMWREPAA